MLEFLDDPIIYETIKIVAAFLILVGVIVFPFRKKNTHMTAAWSSILSWILFAPVLFILLAAGGDYPLFGITFICILCAKDFFQMTGMYHRSFFVWLTYFSIVIMAYAVQNNLNYTYNVIPMLFLGVICLVPIFTNNHKNMLQYISLSLLACLFLGWGFMHLAWILRWDNGVYYLIYIIILSEFCDNVGLAVSRLIGKYKFVDKISPRRTWEGLVISLICTLSIAWGMRHLLPVRTETYWIAAGLIASLVGTVGDLILSVIRRDLGVKDVGIFIIGRGELLDRMDRLIFVAPAFYYVFLNLNKLYLG